MMSGNVQVIHILPKPLLYPQPNQSLPLRHSGLWYGKGRGVRTVIGIYFNLAIISWTTTPNVQITASG